MNDKSDPRGRRRFLGASLGATTALLAGWRPFPASALGASDRIRVGVIGTGGRARGLMRQLKRSPGARRRRSSTIAACSTTRTSTPSSSALPITGTRR